MRATAQLPRLELPAHFEALTVLHSKKGRSVLLAFNHAEDRHEVLKLVHPDAENTSQAGIVEEFLLLDRLRHPHWVRAYGFLRLPDGTCGYRMEALESGAPASPRDPGWEPRDPEAIRQILGALGMLHAAGLAHLDLKPAQILRGKEGIRLADPGLAAPLGTPLAPRGTWGFMAPEILHGRPWDRRADFFSLGCLLVRLWTGESPFGGKDLIDEIRRLSRRPSLRLRDRLSDVPEGLDRFVESLLDPDPSHRPADAAQVWAILHTLAGFREFYLEHRDLPIPADLPFFAPAGLEDHWRDSLTGHGAQRWRISGPLGSGRQRILQRLEAISQTIAGATATKHGNELRVVISDPGGGRRREVRCIVSDEGSADHVVALDKAGPVVARAALEAYGLPPEADEERWTPMLLRLRLEERCGGEGAKRASNRLRRAVAAAWSARIGEAERARLARALAARSTLEAPVAEENDTLVEGGFLRREPEAHRLVPAIPPWEREALEVLAGSQALESAHGELLAQGDPHPYVRAVHAVRSGSADALVAVLPSAIDHLREVGDLSAAMDLLAEAEGLLGADCPSEWWPLHAELAAENGDPARGMCLLDRQEIPEEWRSLLQAVLLYRAGRRTDAIPIARLLRDGGHPKVSPRAATLLVRLLVREGLREAANHEAEQLEETIDSELATSEVVPAATTLLELYSIQGQTGARVDRQRQLCKDLMRSTGSRERYLVAGSLGADAFRRGDFREAGSYLQVAVECAQAWGDVSELLRSQMNVAGVCFEEGRLAESEALNRSVLSSKGLLPPEVAAAALRNLGTVLLSLGRWSESLTLSRSARQEYERLGVPAEANGAALVELAVLQNLGFSQAAHDLIDSLLRCGALDSQPVLMTLLWRERGLMFWRWGETQDAFAAWKHSRDLARSIGAEDELARTLLDEAAASVVWNRCEAASRNLGELEDLLRSTVSLELRVVHAFVQAMFHAARESGISDLEGARARLREAGDLAGSADLRPWTWLCHAAQAGLSARLGEIELTALATGHARDALRDLLGAIGAAILQESYIMLPDPQVFLAWCDHGAVDALLPGRSNLEVFLR